MARSVGGMALSTLVPASVQVLCGLARDPADDLHIWSLHGLWLTAEAAGLSYVPHVQVGSSGPVSANCIFSNLLGFFLTYSKLTNPCLCIRVHTVVRAMVS